MDETRAATILQALIRGYLSRKLFRIALERAALWMQTVVDEIQIFCPEYCLLYGADVIKKSVLINI
jgi:hypothetical protein